MFHSHFCFSGDEATKAIRVWESQQEPQRSPIPIIATTAHAVAGVDQECKAKGMSDYIAKPIMIHQLKEVLKKWHVLAD